MKRQKVINDHLIDEPQSDSNSGLKAEKKDAGGSRINQEELKLYYQQYFPFNHFNFHKFTHKEFSFTLENDVYMRFLSFSGPADFKNMVLKYVPFKIDIGAVYNIKVILILK
jgi:hypothetical protein